MRSWKPIFFLTLFVTGISPAVAEDSVTIDEIIAKVQAAAVYLSSAGEPGLMAFNKADSEFVWKNTYVFVYDCDRDVIAAHPVAASRGAVISGLRGGDGGDFGNILCAAARQKGGAWAEYEWPEPMAENDANHLAYSGDHVRKVSFMLAVKGQPYQVGAGMYDQETSIEELNSHIVE